MNKIIGAVIGLLGAVGNHQKTEDTDSVIIKALAFCREGNESFSREKEDEIYQMVVKEKNIISPGCSSCSTPCGNTSEFDLQQMEKFDDQSKALALEMIQYICESASDFDCEDIDLNDLEIIINQMYCCLTCIGQGGSYEQLLDEFETFKMLNGDLDDSFLELFPDADWE